MSRKYVDTVGRVGASTLVKKGGEHVQTVPTAPLHGKKADQAGVPIGWVRVQADDDPALSVLCELGSVAPHVTDGYGGRRQVPRKGRVALTPWDGFAPLTVELDLLFDGQDVNRSMEPTIAVLEALAGRGKLAQNTTAGNSAPPKVLIDAAGVMPHDAVTYPDLRWGIDQIAWSTGEDDLIVNQDGKRILATCTLTVSQWVTDDRLQDRTLAARQVLQARRGTKGRIITAKEGDTLMSIARRELNDSGRWQQLATLNGIHDPRGIRKGARIKLPA